MAFLSWVVIIFAVGSTDRLFYRLHISYTAQIHFWRIGVRILPVLVFLATRSICRSLRRSGAHPLRGWHGEIVRQRPDGATEVLSDGSDGRRAVRDTGARGRDQPWAGITRALVTPQARRTGCSG